MTTYRERFESKLDPYAGRATPLDARLSDLLPPDLYRVLRLRVVERRTVAETAHHLRIHPETVLLRQHRALQLLRRTAVRRRDPR